MSTPITALCVGRHRFLSDHLGLYFSRIGLRTHCVVGLGEAFEAARRLGPDVVLCEYDLLSTIAIDRWDGDAPFGRVPVMAVSLTRRPEEMHLLDINGIGGFMYLPTLDRHAALRQIDMLRRASEYSPARDLPRQTTAPLAG